MHHVHRVTIIDCFKQLEYVLLNQMSLETCCSLLKDLEQRFIYEFKNQVEFSLPIN